jgi:uncharacterized protein YbdZ (MbtH family)
MYSDDEEDKTIYRVVVNHEEQYSIWPEYKEMPLGWKDVGKSGLKSECLAYIGEVWTDMRPLSLRKHMEEMERKKAAGELEEDDDREPEAWNTGPSLVERLSQGRHPVEVGLRPEKSVSACGGTEIGVRLAEKACDFSTADYENQSGTVHIEGELTLDYVRVRCIADINLATLSGEGHLIPIHEASHSSSQR